MDSRAFRACGQIQREEKLCNSVLGIANQLILRHKAMELRCGKHVTPTCDRSHTVTSRAPLLWESVALFYVEQSGEANGGSTSINCALYCQNAVVS